LRRPSGGGTTKYLVDELNPTGYLQVMDEVSGERVQVRYTFGNMLVSQTRTGNDVPTTSFYGHDSLGSIFLLTDAGGVETDTYTYDAWGNLIGRAGSASNSHLFAGEDFDPDVGLVNLRARQYRPETGRFLTVDPATGLRRRPITFNRYLYANGNPVLFVDPSGRGGDLAVYSILSNVAVATAATLRIVVIPVAVGAFIVLAASIADVNAGSTPILDDLEKDFGEHPNYDRCISKIRADVRAAIKAVLDLFGADTASFDQEVRDIYKDAYRAMQKCLANGGPGN
jgi:RHS repeat-associated protein